MQLLELVRGEHTSDETYNIMADFGESELGKGIVHATDTPNFVGNRIGGYGLIVTVNLAVEQGLINWQVLFADGQKAQLFALPM